MLQSHIAQGNDEKGGVISLIDFVKGVNQSVINGQVGNLDALGQQFGGMAGLQGACLIGLDQLKSALGTPNISDDVKQHLSDFSQKLQAIVNVLRLEGVSPPEYASHMGYPSPGYSPGMSHGPSAVEVH